MSKLHMILWGAVGAVAVDVLFRSPTGKLCPPMIGNLPQGVVLGDPSKPGLLEGIFSGFKVA